MSKKQFFGITFTFLYAVAMLRPLLPVLVYYANYDYIATELCVNKDKPYLDCNGKCYLEAIRKRANPIENQQEPISTAINLADYPISTLDFYTYHIPFNTMMIVVSTPAFKEELKINNYCSDIFHPPEYRA